MAALVSNPFLIASFGLLLMGLTLWFCIALSDEFFGLRAPLAPYAYGICRSALLVLFFAAASAGPVLVASVFARTWLGDRVLSAIVANPRAAVLGSGVAWLPAALLAAHYWSRRRFLKVMELAAPRCPRCDYALRGLPVVKRQIRCPECGTASNVRDIVARYRHHKRMLVIAKKSPWEV